MSSPNFMDFTPAGAMVNAIKAAHASDRRNAEHQGRSSEDSHQLESHPGLIQRLFATLTEKTSAKWKLELRRS